MNLIIYFVNIIKLTFSEVKRFFSEHVVVGWAYYIFVFGLGVTFGKLSGEVESSEKLISHPGVLIALTTALSAFAFIYFLLLRIINLLSIKTKQFASGSEIIASNISGEKWNQFRNLGYYYNRIQESDNKLMREITRGFNP